VGTAFFRTIVRLKDQEGESALVLCSARYHYCNLPARVPSTSPSGLVCHLRLQYITGNAHLLYSPAKYDCGEKHRKQSLADQRSNVWIDFNHGLPSRQTLFHPSLPYGQPTESVCAPHADRASAQSQQPLLHPSIHRRAGSGVASARAPADGIPAASDVAVRSRPVP